MARAECCDCDFSSNELTVYYSSGVQLTEEIARMPEIVH